MSSNTIKLASIAVAVLTVMSGCTSPRVAIDTGIRSNGSALPVPAPAPIKTQPNPVADEATLILGATEEVLAKHFAWIKQSPAMPFEQILVKQDGATTSVLFTASTGKGFYPPGKYDLKTAPQGARGGAAFAAITAAAIEDVLKKVDELGGTRVVTIDVDYAAQADGLPIRGLRYAGEYGEVDLHPDATTLNGVPTAIKIKTGHLVTNEQLAALRAISMRTVVTSKLKEHSLTERFSLTTTKETGPTHRWVSVELRITPAN